MSYVWKAISARPPTFRSGDRGPVKSGEAGSLGSWKPLESMCGGGGGVQLGQTLPRSTENYHWISQCEAIRDLERAVWTDREGPRADWKSEKLVEQGTADGSSKPFCW